MTRDLFGEAARAPPSAGETALVLVLHGQTDRAWLLAEGQDRRAAKWAPKRHVKRGEGRDENVWTMPIWLARERGWM